MTDCDCQWTERDTCKARVLGIRAEWSIPFMPCAWEANRQAMEDAKPETATNGETK